MLKNKFNFVDFFYKNKKTLKVRQDDKINLKMFIPSLYDPYIHNGTNKWKFGDTFSYFNRDVLIPPPGFKKKLTINLNFSDLKITSPIYSPRQFTSNYSPSYTSSSYSSSNCSSPSYSSSNCSSPSSVIVDIEPEPYVVIDIEHEQVFTEPEPSVVIDIEQTKLKKYKNYKNYKKFYKKKG